MAALYIITYQYKVVEMGRWCPMLEVGDVGGLRLT